jgi:hypothetical protein
VVIYDESQVKVGTALSSKASKDASVDLVSI